MAKKNNDGKKLRRVTEEEVKNILEGHYLWIESGGEEGQEGDLSFLDMSKLRLKGLSFNNISFSYSDMSHAQLQGALFKSSSMYGVNFSHANLHGVVFSFCYLQHSNFNNTNLSEVIFSSSYIERANFQDATLYMADLDVGFGQPKLTIDQIKSLASMTSLTAIDQKNIEDEASFEIERLKKKLQEREKQLSYVEESEKEKIKIATELLEKELEEKEKELERERAAKKSTKEDIDKAITHLQAPNNYLKSQIVIQYGLTTLYLILAIFITYFLFHYIKDHYNEFKINLTEKTTFLQWLFYALPIAVCFSLIITFINQINRRLRNVIVLHEKKRYVDSISGGLKAVQELSENNKEARARISGVLDKILNNTITLSEKLQEDTLPDEKPIENKVSLSVKELKDLFSK